MGTGPDATRVLRALDKYIDAKLDAHAARAGAGAPSDPDDENGAQRSARVALDKRRRELATALDVALRPMTANPGR